MSQRHLPPARPGRDAESSSLSRRALFATTALGVPLAVTAVATAPAIADPSVTDGDTRIVDLPLAEAPDRDVDGVGTVRVLTGPATMVGATWTGEAPQQLRARGLSQSDGTWGQWYDLDVEEELVAAEAGGTDAQSGAEEAGAGRPSAEPVWLGAVDEIEVLAVSDGTDVSEHLTAHVLTTSPTDADTSTDTGVQRFSTSASSTLALGPGAPSVISRASWGANESWTGSTRGADELKSVVLHHTAGSNGYSRASSPQLVRGILAYHTQTLGWADIGYNVLVDRFGQVFEGRKGGLHRHIIGAHALGFNTGSFGISVMGDHQSTAASTAAQTAVMEVAAWKLLSAFRTNADETDSWTVGTDGTRWSRGTVTRQRRFFGHRDVNYTSCPGNSLYSRMADLRWGINTRIDGGWRNHYEAFRAGGGTDRLGTVTHAARTEGSHTVTRLTDGIVVSGSGLDARGRATTASFLANWSSAWGRPRAHFRQDGDRYVQAFDKGVAVREDGRNRFVTPSFRDVPPTNAFFLEIGALAERGITTGWPDNTFRPFRNCRRDEMIAFLYRAMGEPAYTAPGTSPFRDVATSASFYAEIAWAEEEGYTDGWPDGTFRPGNTTRRDQVAAFFYRAAGSPSVPGGSTGFSDVPTSHVFAEPIRWMSRTGISRGWADGTFRPTAPVTREQIAAFFMRWLDVTGRL
ncbi:S-layer homology domain-containing protein [Brachybacterium sp.]|uniref:S-layer homology domain-containing protein n=1 Tax=Brachybacterium sp. TaxID=1891286 RepID=UPI002ED61330